MPSTSPRVTCNHPGCGKSVRRSDFNRHLMIHSPDKEDLMYKCPFEGCAYKALQRANVVTHIRIHTGEKSKHCPTCDFSSTDPASITRHRKNRHGYQPKARKDSGSGPHSVRPAPKRRDTRFAPYPSHRPVPANPTGVAIADQRELTGTLGPGEPSAGSDPVVFNDDFAGWYGGFNFDQGLESKPVADLSNGEGRYVGCERPAQPEFENVIYDQTLDLPRQTEWIYSERGDELPKVPFNVPGPVAANRTPSLIVKPVADFWEGNVNPDHVWVSQNLLPNPLTAAPLDIDAFELNTIEQEEEPLTAGSYTAAPPPNPDSPPIHWQSVDAAEHEAAVSFPEFDLSSSFCSSAASSLFLHDANRSSSSLQTSVAADPSPSSSEWSFLNTPSPDGNLSGSGDLSYDSSGSLESQTSFYGVDQWNIPQSYANDVNGGGLQYILPDPNQVPRFSAGLDFGFF